MNLFLFISFILIISVLGLGFLVYFSGRKKRINQIFLFLTISAAIWAIGVISLFFISSIPKQQALLIGRIPFSAAALLIGLIFYFVQIFPRKISLPFFINFLVFSLCSILIYVSLFTDFILRDILFEDTFPIAIFGPFIFLFCVFVIGVFCGTLSLLCSTYKKSKGIEKLQTLYFLVGLALSIITGVFTNLILPQINPNLRLYQFGPFALIFFISFTTLAITRYHLFEIKVILTEILVGAMGIVLLVLPFLMPTANLKILTLGIFILFLIFGYLLVKYTHQEIKRKEELEEAYKRIEALSEMKSEFLKVVNHQLRTPVSIIKGMAEMLREGKISKERQKEFVEKLYLSSERLGTILDDILVAHSLTGGMEKPNFSPCQIEEIVEREVEHFRPQAKAKGIEILFKKPKEPLPITLADETMVERIISRLIDNAILYSEKGEIEVSIDLEKENKKEWIKISVKDQGIGLDERDKENLFKLFYRGEKATFMHPNGSGLGLFIVKNYVEAHRGKIEAKSEGREKGSTFIVSLPVITEL